jgi:hypothetical protein
MAQHRSGMDFDTWCKVIATMADVRLGGANLINWSNVPFNWADRYQDGDPDLTTADALVIAAWGTIKEAFAVHELT